MLRRCFRIFLASSTRNQRAAAVARALSAAGHDVFSLQRFSPLHWRSIAPSSPFCSAAEQRSALGDPRVEQAFQTAMGALIEADLCVLVLPAGASSHAQAGFAAGTGKRTIVPLADGAEPELMHKMAISVCSTVDELLDVVAAAAVRRPMAERARPAPSYPTAWPPTLPPRRPPAVYVASSLRNERFPEVVAQLAAAGHEPYDFRAQPTFVPWSSIAPSSPFCSAAEQIAALEHRAAERAFVADLSALAGAPVCLAVLPAGASTHMELGFAVGACKRTFVMLDELAEPELMHKMAASVCSSIDEVLLALRSPSPISRMRARS